MNIQKLVASICYLSPRRVGTVGEIMVNKIVKSLEKADNQSYDRKLIGKKVEIKISRAFIKESSPITEKNICGMLMRDNAPKLVEDKYKLSESWDCNIQQVKPAFFDILWYAIFFKDAIYVFKITSEQIIKEDKIGYCHKQHANSIGEGQFHIKPRDFEYHFNTYLYTKLCYNELWELLND